MIESALTRLMNERQFSDAAEIFLLAVTEDVRARRQLGIAGVKVIVSEHRDNDAKALTEELISDSILDPPHWRVQYQREDEIEARRRIRPLADALFDEFSKIPNLAERILEALGYKHYDPDELAEAISSNDPHYSRVENVLFLSRILSRELVPAGFDPHHKAPFEGWNEVVSRATERILSVAARQFNDYEVTIFLNAPMIDEEFPLPLAEVALQGSGRDLSIGYATDELLARLHASDRNAQLHRINTAVSFPIAVSVSAPVESYLNVYTLGAQIAEMMVDCLRLIRDEDIGVMALEVFPTDVFMPSIRKTYEVFYQSELAPFVPKRFSFEVAQTPPLCEEELAQLRTLLSSYSGVTTIKGLDIAVRRFRSSCERYHPSDPERLLDIAFSFEAIFLNDGETKELNYRLSLRVARFLGNTIEERLDIFDTVKTLYNFRSKIAHGETFDTMKESDAEKLKKVLAHAPRILKGALLSMILGNGPKGLVKNDKLADWWRRLELN